MRLRLTVKCRHCHESVSEHLSSCPMLAYEEAQRRLLCYGCPSCGACTVEVNDSDYFECRSCHRQFSRAAHHDGEGSRLYLETGDDILPIVVLPEQGKGNIPALVAFEEACKRLELAEEQLEETEPE